MFTYNSYPNIPYVASNLLPGGFMNIAGDSICYTVPDELLDGTNFSLALNQNAQNKLAQNMYPYLNIGQTPIPNVNDYVNGLVNQYQQGQVERQNAIISQKINSNLASVQSTKAKLNSMLTKEGITDKEKSDINKLLDELEEQENALQELIKNAAETSPEEANKKVDEISQKIREINNNVSNVGKLDESFNKKDDKVEDKKDEKIEKEDDDKKEETQGTGNKNFSKEVKTDVEKFYRSTYRIGSDESAMNEVLANIDSDNVMEYMAAWNKYHGGEKGESFMHAFMADANEGFWGGLTSLWTSKLFGYGAVSKQKVNGCRQVEFALREKAEELGIYDECAADFAAIDKECGSLLWMSDKIYKHFDNIIKKIGDKMGGKYKDYAAPKKL